jgi:hypothetical protein
LAPSRWPRAARPELISARRRRRLCVSAGGIGNIFSAAINWRPRCVCRPAGRTCRKEFARVRPALISAKIQMGLAGRRRRSSGVVAGRPAKTTREHARIVAALSLSSGQMGVKSSGPLPSDIVHVDPMMGGRRRRTSSAGVPKRAGLGRRPRPAANGAVQLDWGLGRLRFRGLFARVCGGAFALAASRPPPKELIYTRPSGRHANEPPPDRQELGRLDWARLDANQFALSHGRWAARSARLARARRELPATSTSLWLFSLKLGAEPTGKPQAAARPQ